MARSRSPSRGPRPKQGARLLSFRQAAGLTQTELARLVDVPLANIPFWEWSDKPPRSDVLPKMAKVLGVSVDDLLGEHTAAPRRSGPVGKLERVFEQARSLSRRDQELVVRFVTTLLEQHQKAS